MHCEECGLLLDGVSDEQIVKENKYRKEIVYCPKHAELLLDVTA